jgi:hypothetical protein
LIWSACSATSLGMPGMSEGIQAKISLLMRWKSTSVSSYLGVSVEPTLNFFSPDPWGREGSL